MKETKGSEKPLPTFHPAEEDMVEGLWYDEEDRQVAKIRRRLFRKSNKTPEDWRLLWDLAPPFRTPEGWFWVDPFHLTPHLTPSQMQRMNEHAYNHRPGALPPTPLLQGPPPSPYHPPANMWRPEKRKESYPAAGTKKRRVSQD